MNIDELLNKFDSIEELPVSEEMLGAYMEGNLDFFETANISSEIQNNEYLSDIVHEIKPIDDPYLSHSVPFPNIEIPTDSLLMAQSHDFAERSWDDNYEDVESFLDASLTDNTIHSYNERLSDDYVANSLENQENYSIGNDRNYLSDDSLDLDSSDMDNLEDFENLKF